MLHRLYVLRAMYAVHERVLYTCVFIPQMRMNMDLGMELRTPTIGI